MLKRTSDRLIVALSLALEEIHHPGSARHNGIDITALIEGVLKEARATKVPQMVRDEYAARADTH